MDPKMRNICGMNDLADFDLDLVAIVFIYIYIYTTSSTGNYDMLNLDAILAGTLGT